MIEADQVSFDELFGNEEESPQAPQKQSVVGLLFLGWLKQITILHQQNRQLHKLQESMKRVSQDEETEKVLKEAQSNLDLRLESAGVFTQAFISAVPIFNPFNVGHFAGMCACHGLSLVTNSSQFFMLPEGIHIHVGENGEEFLHDHSHHSINKLPTLSSNSRRNLSDHKQTANIFSSGYSDSGVSFLPEIKFFGESVGLEKLFEFGLTNSISPLKALTTW